MQKTLLVTGSTDGIGLATAIGGEGRIAPPHADALDNNRARKVTAALEALIDNLTKARSS